MAINKKHYDEIRSVVEQDNGWLLSLHFFNKQYLVKEYLDSYPAESRFSFKASSFQWNTFTHVAHEQFNVFTIKTSFHVEGDLIFYQTLKETHRKRINVNVGLDVVTQYYPENDMILYSKEDFIVRTNDLQSMAVFDDIVQNEFDKLSFLKPLDFGIVDKIWPYNEEGNEVQVFISSLSYFSEIENIYRQVKYSIALANTYAHYANQYYMGRANGPIPHYPINLTSYDRRYLDYCTNAVHSLYVYWERIALLIFQYYQPKKVTDKNLSFAKLIGSIEKETKQQAIDVKWFTDFLMNDHQKLQVLRHPLVHYKLTPGDNQGSYLPMIFDNWLSDIKNGQRLLAMEEASRGLIGNIIKLTEKCQEGHERAIQLIVDLKTAVKQPVIQ